MSPCVPICRKANNINFSELFEKKLKKVEKGGAAAMENSMPVS